VRKAVVMPAGCHGELLPRHRRRAPHRTGALAHGLADISGLRSRIGGRGGRTETAQTAGVAECGNYDTYTRTPSGFHDGAVDAERARGALANGSALG
jgi:hypothetical protein